MFEKICEIYNLGKFRSIEEITGGLTNKLYKLTTDTNTYAIKMINPDNITNNPDLLNKIEISEKLANIAKENGVNAVCAYKYNGKYIQDLESNYFLVYEWINGNILLTKEIGLDHVRKAAKELSILHSIPVTLDKEIVRYKKIDFNYYYNLIKNNNEEWSKLFRDNILLLLEIYDKVYENYLKISNEKSYVHKDYNRKNILWNKNNPYIIDWETATIDNPMIDCFNSAWFLTADVSYDKYFVFVEEYLKQKQLPDDIEIYAYASIIEECNWLEFSLKRALQIHSKDLKEIQLGKDSISTSLTEIFEYYKKIPLMLEIINEVKRGENYEKSFNK